MTSGDLPHALQLLQGGEVAKAAEVCRTILAKEPGQPDALGLLGLARLQAGSAAEAADLLGRALMQRPGSVLLYFHRGQALAAIPGRDAEAADAFRAAVQLAPTQAEAHHQFGNMLKRLGRYAEAVPPLTEAARLQPSQPLIWLNLGVAQLESGAPVAAVESFRRAVALAPTMPEAHNVLGAALIECGAVSAAEAAFDEALRLKPGYAAACNNRGRARKGQGRIDAAIADYRAALAAVPDAATHSNLVYALNFSATASPDEVWAEHAEWGRRYGASPGGTAPPVARTADKRRLRIGFVSPDFVNHAVAYFFEPLLEQLSHTAFETFCYSDAPVPDRVTERLRGLSQHWHDSARLRDAELEQLIHADQIDVLVDLAGHTARNRLRVFARKPAPVQMTWLGYPNTTGVRAIDYRITDERADPAGTTEAWHAETLVRLPGSFLCYKPPLAAPEVNDLPAAQSEGMITFASFSNFAKVSAPCLEAWAQVLQAVPGSRLLLKSRGLADPAVAARIDATFSNLGVAPGRVRHDGTLVSVAAHLQQYHAVDIALDPFPYHGTTTTCEALWMGVPVVSLAGRTHVSRVGVSLLTSIGHPEWIATRVEDYVRTATALATEQVRLARIRRELRPRMQASPLCDAKGFAREFEEAVQGMWRARVAVGG